MTALSFYTVAIVALILLIVLGVIIGIYLVFRTYNRRRQQTYMAEWQADRRQRE
ncbi:MULTISPECIES: hypothetical protein [Terribacillus]|jgi:heme/copper-type cytochrome/quinol oxidase subunit 2|uniref:hypothetical protein n=1 Tax=Terribacillus TaxID=459532 RepID=UPI001582EF45|nr:MULTISPECIES: hypothetical protein [Terribacillus]